MNKNTEFKTFRNILKKEINSYLEKDKNEILKPLKLKIVNLIFKNLDESRHFINQKIFLDMQLYVEIHNNELIKKNALAVHNLIKELKTRSFISKSSKDYPKNQVIFSSNPLNSAFLNTNLMHYDRIISIKDKFIESLLIGQLSNDNQKNLEYEINLFKYFKLFLIEKIPNTYYQYFTRNNILYAGNKIILVVKEEVKNGFIPLHTIIFDEFTSNILNKIFPKYISTTLDSSENIFSENYDFYIKKLTKFCKENSLSIKEIKNVIKLEYQIINTPLDLTLKMYLKHPKISLFEIEKLYPGSVKQELLNIEKNNLEIYRNINQDNEIAEETDDEYNLENSLTINYELYENLKKILKVPKNKKNINRYLENCYMFVNRNRNKVEQFKPIFNHVEFLLKKIDINFTKKTIELLTLQNYLHTIFHYCFDVFIKSVNNDDALKNIDYKLKNSDLNPNVQISYQNRILVYLKKELNLEFNKISTTINYNRSIIFEDELDKLIKKLQYRDRKLYQNEILINRRAVFCILSYYCGLRRGELISRTLRDFYHVEENIFYINVNKYGINIINKKNKKKIVSLKNNNSKRAFNFVITNSKHLNIVKDYYNDLSQKNIYFLFPNSNKDGSVSKHNLINISDINDINSILQDTTKRYTVLHSFRHTYATNEMKKILGNQNKKIEDLFDLVVRIGHSGPETTLDNYIHLDLIYLDK
jgi:integrase